MYHADDFLCLSKKENDLFELVSGFNFFLHVFFLVYMSKAWIYVTVINGKEIIRKNRTKKKKGKLCSCKMYNVEVFLINYLHKSFDIYDLS